jgi:hypothetical protein
MNRQQPLVTRTALVAGATRGAGRAFAIELEPCRNPAADQEPRCISETPHYVARAAVAFAADPDRARLNGQSLASWDLGPAYGVTDVDGTQPHMLRYHREVIEAGKPADDTGYR